MAVVTRMSKEEDQKGEKVKCLKQWHSWCTHGMHVASWSHSCKTCGQLVYMLRKLACFWSRPAALKMDGVEKKHAVIVQELQDACLQCLVNTCVDLEGSCMHACYIMSFSASVEAWWTHPSPKAGLIYWSTSACTEPMDLFNTCMHGVCGCKPAGSKRKRKSKSRGRRKKHATETAPSRSHDPAEESEHRFLLNSCMHACMLYIFSKHACMHIKQVLTWLPPDEMISAKNLTVPLWMPSWKGLTRGPKPELGSEHPEIYKYIDGWGWLC